MSVDFLIPGPARCRSGRIMNEKLNSDHRIFVSYIDKSREYYLAQGYGNPYRWAHFDEVPFGRLARPLSESRIGLVTTASLPQPEPAPDSFAIAPVVYAAPTDPAPTSLYTDHRFWDKDATHTHDIDSFAPINRLREAEAAGKIGSLSPRFYGIPTVYSQRQTMESDCPELLGLCREDGVDAAILVAL